MATNVEMEKIIDDLKIVDTMYELIRIVDPLKKKIMATRNNCTEEFTTHCFDAWKKNEMCLNCVSMRAFNEKQTLFKVEYNPHKIYMVTAIPIEFHHQRFVIELLKDATQSMIFENGNDQNTPSLHKVIDNLNNLVVRDPLTGTFNRRYINEKLPVDLINALFSNQKLSLIMADIDLFKKVNDTYGHLIGDRVLNSFSKTISSCIKREGDWISRYGGDEFFICLPGAGLDKAREIAEQMRAAVESEEIRCDTHLIRITGSFGVYSADPHEGDTVESLIEAADNALYKAKENGRNRVGTMGINH